MKVSGLLCLVALFVFVGLAGAQVKPLFIDCGSNSTTNVDGRIWVGDIVSGNNLSLSYPGFVASMSKTNGDSTYGALYRTARIFNASSMYTFNVSAGSYYIRLHFYSFMSGNVGSSLSTFDVTANNLRLLSKYNVSEEIARKNSYLQSLGSNFTAASVLKEYFLNISSSELQIKFDPSSGSIAFVNAVEIIPVLDKLFFGSANNVGSLGVSSPLNLIDGGMETMYRLNVGGPEVASNQDQDLWRKWELDDLYMHSANAATVKNTTSNISYANSNDSSIAPLLVYKEARISNSSDVQKYNMSWKFNIEPNFNYLVRLHFCELSYDGEGLRIFRIYIGFTTAAQNYDVFAQAGGKNKAYHEDYLDTISSDTGILWLQLGPDPSAISVGSDALLNGLEIFKLSRDGSLAYVSDMTGSRKQSAHGNGAKNKYVWVGICAGAFALLIVSGLCFLFFCFCIHKKKTAPEKSNTPKWRPLVLDGTTLSITNAGEAKTPSIASGSIVVNRIGRRFSITDIRVATKTFDESLVLGSGGFGKVYKGEIEEGILVAIKRAHPHSKQGLAEFETEIEMLSKLRHRHLVSMIGYCDEQGEMILVYEYMANGTLRNHLFGSDLPPLSWKQRLHACIGAARGLHYLHTGADRGIIHRDVKTTNILLDENFVAKMADFGLSKKGPALDHTHVSTAVRGSFGYLDPEYFRRQKLTQKSDVYSFGVVLFEVLCGRPVIDPSLPKDQINLAEWAVRWQQQGLLENIVDPRLEGDYSAESLNKFGEIAYKCLADDGRNRPTIGDVLWNLEYVLQLHEACTRSINGDCSSSKVELQSTDIAPSLPLIKEGDEDASPGPTSLEERSLLSMSTNQWCSEDTIEDEYSKVAKPQLRSA